MEMHDFKLGDEIWWFEFPEQCLGFTKDLSLKHSLVDDPFDGDCIYLKNGYFLYEEGVDVYRSKAEAIDAMLEQLRKISV